MVSPAARRRSSVRGPMPGSARSGSGARKAASSPGATTVTPPGLSRSDATLATTLQVATPSEHDRRTRSATARRTAWAASPAPSSGSSR